MDIGLVKRSFRLQGGGERQIGYLIEGLLAQGHRVHLFSEQPPGSEPVEGLIRSHIPGIPVSRAFRALGFAFMARAAVRRAGLAVVQSFDRTLGQQIYRAGEGVHREWLQRKRRSLSGVARGWSHVNVYDHAILALERRVFSQTPWIIPNSRRGEAEVARHYGVSRERMRTIYNGVDTERFHRGVRRRFREGQRAAWGVSSGELVLLCVGSGFHRKGLGAAIEALAVLRRRGLRHVRLVVVGRGRPGPYLRLASGLGVAALVQWDGQRADVERCYAGADVFVLPTLYDPFANACLEAMACGLPVVTTVANGAAELMRDGIHGAVLHDAPGAEALAEALLPMLQRRERLEAMGEAASRVAREYPLSQSLAASLQLYESVAERGVPV
jgi:UDP-glucose:(heptosyl)LPS alpha-1,3-glucosyltransferase